MAEKELAFKLNDKCSPVHLNVRIRTKELVMFQVAIECHGNRPLNGQTRTAQGNFVQLSSGTAARRHEKSPCTTESSKTPSVTLVKKGDDELFGVDMPTLSTS